VTDITEAVEHNPAGAVRVFRNTTGTGFFPDGIIRILQNLPGRAILVEYVTPPKGLEGHRFYVDGHELTRPTQPVIDIDAWWVVVIPGVPTFYLNGTVQGITSKLHAAKIASQIHTTHSVGPSNIERLRDILS
jgi:hypothetical protein